MGLLSDEKTETTIQEPACDRYYVMYTFEGTRYFGSICSLQGCSRNTVKMALKNFSSPKFSQSDHFFSGARMNFATARHYLLIRARTIYKMLGQKFTGVIYNPLLPHIFVYSIIQDVCNE